MHNVGNCFLLDLLARTHRVKRNSEYVELPTYLGIKIDKTSYVRLVIQCHRLFLLCLNRCVG